MGVERKVSSSTEVPFVRNLAFMKSGFLNCVSNSYRYRVDRCTRRYNDKPHRLVLFDKEDNGKGYPVLFVYRNENSELSNFQEVLEFYKNKGVQPLCIFNGEYKKYSASNSLLVKKDYLESFLNEFDITEYISLKWQQGSRVEVARVGLVGEKSIQLHPRYSTSYVDVEPSSKDGLRTLELRLREDSEDTVQQTHRRQVQGKFSF